jgi:gamma-glutamylcyclotransferase (GGCT)/AIG2-like uncharacterized protein YtfP
MSSYLFVYGTLMRGECRQQFLADQQFLGAAATVAGYRLYNVGQYPALVVADAGVSIIGELWRVDDAKLLGLDIVEEVSAGLYARQPVRLRPPHEKLIVETYFYLPNVMGLPELGSDWRAR